MNQTSMLSFSNMIISYTEMMLSSTNTHDYYCFLLPRSPIECKEKQTWALPLLGEQSARELLRLQLKGREEAIFCSLTGSQSCSEHYRFGYVLLFLPFKIRAPFPQTLVTV